MAILKATAILWPYSDASEDIHINTWYVNTGVTAPAAFDFPGWEAALGEFYDASKFSGNVLRPYGFPKGEVKFYDAQGSQPNYPLHERSWTKTTVSYTYNLPPELCVCLSFANDTNTSVPRGRRRGRIYIGGLENDAIDGEARVTSDTRSALVANYQTYVTALEALGAYPVVYSRVNGTGYQVERVWVDDEVDIQRRRGRKPTTYTEQNIVYAP